MAGSAYQGQPPPIQALGEARASDDRGPSFRRLGAGHVQQHPEAGRIEGIATMHRFLIVIERAGDNYSAYSPDLPGCVATGATREETERRMYEAIQFHIEGLIEDKLPVPESTSFAEFVVVAG